MFTDVFHKNTSSIFFGIPAIVSTYVTDKSSQKSFTQVFLSCFYKSLNYFQLHSVAAPQLTNQEALLHELFFCFISLINFTVHRSEMKLKTFIAFFLLLMFSGYCESKGGRGGGGFSSRGGGFSSRGKISGSSGSSWFSSSKPASSPSFSRPSPSYSGSPSSYNSPSAPSYGWNVNKPSPSSGN